MGIFKNIFTWWEGATLGTWLNTQRNGVQLGEDDQGNRYFEGKAAMNSTRGTFKRRWVMYAGANDSSLVPPEWHCWLHHQLDDVPDKALPPPRSWISAPTPNLTGTAQAYHPKGANGAGDHRARSTGDYVAWSPEQGSSSQA